MRLAPSIQEVWLDNFVLSEDPSHPVSKNERIRMGWPQLQRVYCGEVFTQRPFLLPRPLTDQLIELHCEDDKIIVDVEHPTAYMMARAWVPALDRLQKLSIKIDHRLRLDLQGIKELLQPPLQSGSLEELVLDLFPSESLSLSSEGGFSWMQSDRLAFLGIGGINAEVGRYVDDPDALLLGLVAQFPNLRALDIGTEAFRASTLVKIITLGVTRIYHRNPMAQIAEVLDWTREHGNKYGGAQLITGPWPHTPANLCDRWAVRQRTKRDGRPALTSW